MWNFVKKTALHVRSFGMNSLCYAELQNIVAFIGGVTD